MRLAGRLQEIYKEYGDQADFWWIYTQEAHATDGRRPNRSVKVESHKTIEDRKTAAQGCVATSVLKVPVLLDDMKDSAATAYSAMPERFFILNPNGKVSFAGGRGPRGVDLDALEESLKALVKESE